MAVPPLTTLIIASGIELWCSFEVCCNSTGCFRLCPFSFPQTLSELGQPELSIQPNFISIVTIMRLFVVIACLSNSYGTCLRSH